MALTVDTSMYLQSTVVVKQARESFAYLCLAPVFCLPYHIAVSQRSRVAALKVASKTTVAITALECSIKEYIFRDRRHLVAGISYFVSQGVTVTCDKILGQ